jgi:signal transduction histidine kinase
MGGRSTRDAAVASGVLVVVLVIAVAAERVGYERDPVGDLVAGSAVALAGAVLALRRDRAVAGALLLAAAASWFAVTAYDSLPFGDVLTRHSYLHRALVLAGVVTAAGRARSGVPRALVWLTVGVSLFVALDADRAADGQWWVLAGSLAISALAVGVGARAWPAMVGVVLVCGAGPASEWLGDLQLRTYYLGLVVCAGGAVLLARPQLRPDPRSAEGLVRDGGDDDVRIGFRDRPDGPFLDLAGDPVDVPLGDGALVVPAGDGAGESVIVLPQVATTTGAARRDLVRAVELLRAHRDALLDERRQAQQIAASEQRIRAADAAAAADLGWELERTVIPRLTRAIETLHDDDPTERAARKSLLAVVAEVRAIASGLTPDEMLTDLADALATVASRSPIPVEVQLADVELSAPTALALYFVVAEAVTNAVRHSGATRIVVRLREVSGGVELTVADDGRGGAVTCDGGGLSGLQQRLAPLGASLAVGDRPQGGAVVAVHVPAGDGAQLTDTRS